MPRRVKIIIDRCTSCTIDRCRDTRQADVIMEQQTKEDGENMDKPVEEDVLSMSNGPMTRARSKRLKEAIGGLLKLSLKQEEDLGESLINQDTLITIQAITPSI